MRRILPDGMTGAIMAIEGISDAVVFLHGPGGCRVRHMVVSSAVFPKEPVEDPYMLYYYGYPQVPSSYLDEYDFINGAFYKSREGLGTVRRTSPSLIVVLDSPGAGLIGDDHGKAILENDLGGIAMHIQESMASVPVPVSFDGTLRKVMEFLGPERRCVRRGTVNVLGLSLMDKDWKAARDEVCRHLSDMGLEVISCPGAGSFVEDLTESVNAEYNVVVCPEMCAGLLEWYEGFGIPAIRSDAGAPVGLDATEAWIRAVAEFTGRDPAVPLANVDRCRGHIFEKLSGMRYNALRLRGLTFSVAGTASVIRPLTEWLYSYLAMAPVAVKADRGSDADETDALRRFLSDVGFGGSWDKEPVPCGAVLCEGIAALTMQLSDECRVGIPIGYSSMGIDDIIPRPVYGLRGVLYIMDELLHGVRAS